MLSVSDTGIGIPAGTPGSHLRAVLPRRQRPLAEGRRRRAGTGDLQVDRRGPRRTDLRLQPSSAAERSSRSGFPRPGSRPHGRDDAHREPEERRPTPSQRAPRTSANARVKVRLLQAFFVCVLPHTPTHRHASASNTRHTFTLPILRLESRGARRDSDFSVVFPLFLAAEKPEKSPNCSKIVHRARYWTLGRM